MKSRSIIKRTNIKFYLFGSKTSYLYRVIRGKGAYSYSPEKGAFNYECSNEEFAKHLSRYKTIYREISAIEAQLHFQKEYF